MHIFGDIQAPDVFKIYDASPVLKLKFSFHAHCRIYFSPDRYKDLENHLYVFYVTVSSPLNDMGMAVDFFHIEDIFTTHIKPFVDQQLLNQTLPSMNMTTENIAHWLYETFEEHLPANTTMETLELFETANHSVLLMQYNRPQ